ARRQDSGGDNKRIAVEFSTDNGTSWSPAGVRNLPAGSTGWLRYTSALIGVTNPNNLLIRLNVDDGSTYRFDFWSWRNQYKDRTNPHVLIDNFQVRASTLASPGMDFDWNVVSGDNTSLP